MHRRRARTGLLLFAFLLAGTAALPAQNSTRKLRATPSATAARAGSAVQWREDPAAALAEAQQKSLPVFWYIPTVQGSPMDRKDVIDRYLMAGPFSWPAIVRLLNERTIPLRAVARGELQQRHGLRRLEFIEPGWLLLGGDGKELARMQQITTLHPQWFAAALRRALGMPAADLAVTDALQDVWAAYRRDDLAAVERLAAAVVAGHPAPAVAAEARFLQGAAMCRSHRPLEARALWSRLADDLPDEPWAWKAAAEAEGHGPFGRGFEDFGGLPEAVLRVAGEGSRAPPSSYAEAELWRRGVAFLLRMEEGDGMYRDSTYDFGGSDSLPNVHGAVAALCGMALLAAAQRHDEGAVDLGAAGRQELATVLARIVAGAGDDGLLALEDRDEILWAWAYRARLLARVAAARPGDAAAAARAPLQHAVDRLQALQPENGAWFHEYANPFAIATALQALHVARAAGATVDQDKIDRGLRALAHCRAQNGAYTYGYGRGAARAAVPGAAGRMPICELALRLWDGSDDDRLRAAVAAGMEHHGLLARVRKYDDHADEHGYGGFFFWFDLLGRAEAVMALPPDAERERWRAQLRKLVLDLPEFDGAFVDSHELGRCYGTAMGLLCLAALGDGG